jgi:hypothetical protein
LGTQLRLHGKHLRLSGLQLRLYLPDLFGRTCLFPLGLQLSLHCCDLCFFRLQLRFHRDLMGDILLESLEIGYRRLGRLRR